MEYFFKKDSSESSSSSEGFCSNPTNEKLKIEIIKGSYWKIRLKDFRILLKQRYTRLSTTSTFWV